MGTTAGVGAGAGVGSAGSSGCVLRRQGQRQRLVEDASVSRSSKSSARRRAMSPWRTGCGCVAGCGVAARAGGRAARRTPRPVGTMTRPGQTSGSGSGVGLTELRRRLAMAVHESLSQRLVVRHHLTGLDRDELDAYLTHRLRLAGCEVPLFEPPAIEALFQSARGLPRLVNRIAHYALTAAAVNAGHLEHAVAELRL